MSERSKRTMKKLFTPLVVIVAAMFAYAPVAIQQCAVRVDDGAGAEDLLLPRAVVDRDVHCGRSSAASRARSLSSPAGRSADRVALAAAELAVLFGLIGLITGPLWGRKAWGVWWQWDARLTSALVMWLVFVAYLLLRKYGGAGSEKLSAVLALFGMANVPFVYWSVNVWRTVHPKTTVVMTLEPAMGRPFCCVRWRLSALFALLLAARVRLENVRAAVDELYLALED